MLKLLKMLNKLFNNVSLSLFPSSLVKLVRNVRQKNAKLSMVKTYSHQLISLVLIATMNCWSYTWRNTGKLLSRIKKENKLKNKMKTMMQKEMNHKKNDYWSNIYIMLNYLNKIQTWPITVPIILAQWPRNHIPNPFHLHQFINSSVISFRISRRRKLSMILNNTSQFNPLSRN